VSSRSRRAFSATDRAVETPEAAMTLTVIQHVLERLKAIGVDDVFGVPGDYAFPVNDAICNDPRINWIGCSNELNAAYAADGYARIKGVAALCTTYGVGELSAINGIAGAYAEHLPIFHLVGAPNMSVQQSRAVMHHTLGNGEYDLFRRMSLPVVCADAVMTPQNVAYETERLIFEALYHRRPVYMAFPADFADQPVLGSAAPIPAPQSDPAALEAATVAIIAALAQAKTACVLPGILVGFVNSAAGIARQGVGQFGAQVGREMCGPGCAPFGRQTAQGAFDQSQRFTNTYSPMLQRFGYQQFGPGRPSYLCGGNSGIAGTSPQACLPQGR
jgi:thiamine pyrophosphate-dependent acetolactate synthase large subunit-like protein